MDNCIIRLIANSVLNTNTIWTVFYIKYVSESCRCRVDVAQNVCTTFTDVTKHSLSTFRALQFFILIAMDVILLALKRY